MQKPLALLILVVIVGAGAHMYLKKMDMKDATMKADDAYMNDGYNDPEEDDDTGSMSEESVESSEPVAPTTPVNDTVVTPTPAPAPEPSGSTVSDTLADLDSLFEDDEYDDSSLDAQFEDNLDQSYGF